MNDKSRYKIALCEEILVFFSENELFLRDKIKKNEKSVCVCVVKL